MPSGRSRRSRSATGPPASPASAGRGLAGPVSARQLPAAERAVLEAGEAGALDEQRDPEADDEPGHDRGEKQQLELREAVARGGVGLLDDLERDLPPSSFPSTSSLSASARAFAPPQVAAGLGHAPPAPGNRRGEAVPQRRARAAPRPAILVEQPCRGRVAGALACLTSASLASFEVSIAVCCDFVVALTTKTGVSGIGEAESWGRIGRGCYSARARRRPRRCRPESIGCRSRRVTPRPRRSPSGSPAWWH